MNVQHRLRNSDIQREVQWRHEREVLQSFHRWHSGHHASNRPVHCQEVWKLHMKLIKIKLLTKNDMIMTSGREWGHFYNVNMCNAVVPKLFPCADHLGKFRGPRSTKYWAPSVVFPDLFRDSRTTSANLADHQWSAEQTLGITGVMCRQSRKVCRKVGWTDRKLNPGAIQTRALLTCMYFIC